MCEFWYDYIKPNYQNNAKLCYMDTDSFIIQIKTDNFYRDIVDDVKKLWNTSNYGEDDKGPPPSDMNQKIIGLMKYELGGKIMIEFVALWPTTHSYLMDDDKRVKKAKWTKKCV